MVLILASTVSLHVPAALAEVEVNTCEVFALIVGTEEALMLDCSAMAESHCSRRRSQLCGGDNTENRRSSSSDPVERLRINASSFGGTAP